VWRELRAGAAAFLGSRVLVAVMVAGAITNFGGNVINTLDVFFVQTNLHTDPKLYGILETALGLGSIAGALVASAVAQRFGLSRTFWWGLLGAGVLVVGYARTTSFPVALLVLLAVGVPIAAINTVVSPIVIREVPRAMLGRAFAFLQPSVQLSSLFAVGLAGWLASSVLTGLDTHVAGLHFRTYDTLFTASGLLIALGGLYAMVALRGTDRARVPAPVPEPVPAPTVP
jgi:MFS family permease